MKIWPTLTRSAAPLPRHSSTGAGDSEPQRDRQENILFWFFAIEAVGLTFLQKFGYGSTPDTVVPLLLPMMLAGVASLMFFIKPSFNPIRFGLFIATFAFAALSTILQQQSSSTASFALLVVVYLPLLVSFPIKEATFKRCLDFFSSIMVIMAGIVFAQHLIQMGSSWRAWPDLDKLIPEQFLVPNYTYHRTLDWVQGLMSPQAIFFLEVSFCSQFLVIALACEIVYLRRTWRIVLFAAALLSTFAGTGILLLILTLPVLIGRMSLRSGGLIVAGLMIVAIGAIELGWVEFVSRRADEYQHYGSSANFRFIEPWNRLVLAIKSSNALFVGIGPGQMEKTRGTQWWPVTKAAVEYGFVMALFLNAFIAYCLFQKAPSRQISFMLLVWFSIEGALLTEVNVATLALFATLFVVEADEQSDRKRKRRRRSSQDTRAAAVLGI